MNSTIFKIVIALAFAVFAAPAVAAPDENVQCVQAHLKSQGIQVDVDGLYGPGTQASADKWQSYAVPAKDLPQFSKETAEQWCNTLRPPINLEAAFYKADFQVDGVENACGVLAVTETGTSYKFGSCAGSALIETFYTASNVVVDDRVITIDSATCSNGTMTAGGAALSCTWEFNGLVDQLTFFPQNEQFAGF